MAPNVTLLPAYKPWENMVKELALWLTKGEGRVKVITLVNTFVTLFPIEVRIFKRLIHTTIPTQWAYVDNHKCSSVCMHKHSLHLVHLEYKYMRA